MLFWTKAQLLSLFQKEGREEEGPSQVLMFSHHSALSPLVPFSCQPPAAASGLAPRRALLFQRHQESTALRYRGSDLGLATNCRKIWSAAEKGKQTKRVALNGLNFAFRKRIREKKVSENAHRLFAVTCATLLPWPTVWKGTSGAGRDRAHSWKGELLKDYPSFNETELK